jgi:hypothetical protein
MSAIPVGLMSAAHIAPACVLSGLRPIPWDKITYRRLT